MPSSLTTISTARPLTRPLPPRVPFTWSRMVPPWGRMPRTLAWTAYDVGSAGYIQAASIGHAMSKREGITLRVVPAGNDVSRQASLAAGRALEALSTPVRVDGKELSVRTSIGIVEGPVAGLTAADPQAAELVKLRYFAGMSIPEAAEALGLSRSALYRRLQRYGL